MQPLALNEPGLTLALSPPSPALNTGDATYALSKGQRSFSELVKIEPATVPPG